MTLKPEEALIYLLLPEPEDQWREAVRERYEHGIATDRRALLPLFFFAQSRFGDAMLQTASASADEITRSIAAGMLSSERAVAASGNLLTTKAESSLRAERTARLKVVSDEALSDVQDLTMQLIQARNPRRRN